MAAKQQEIDAVAKKNVAYNEFKNQSDMVIEKKELAKMKKIEAKHYGQ